MSTDPLEQDALQYDAIVIGAGHNGLVAAGYLAKAGKNVVVLDSAEVVGGAAQTAEISPDYQVSTAAHLVSGFPRQIEKDLKLSKHGLAWATKDMATIALDRDGKHIVLSSDRKTDLATIAAHASHDGDAWKVFEGRVAKYVKLLKPLLDRGLPTASGERATRAATMLALRLEKMGPADLRAFLQLVPSSVAALLDRSFEGDLIKGALSLQATLGAHAGPNTPGTAFSLIYGRTQQAIGQGLGYPVGGTGALTEALASAAEALGARIRLESPVREIIVENGQTKGVRLADGTLFEAPIVLSSIDPKTTCLDLVGARHFETPAVNHVSRIKMKGATAKINLALEGLPTFENFSDREYGGRLLIAPDMGTVERSFTAAKRGELTLEPVMEVVIPSYHDPRLAPMGHHVMSVIVPNVPFEVEGGWEAQKEPFVKRVIDTIAEYAPDLGDKIIAGEVLTPPELDDRFGWGNRGWHQGNMSFDQLLAFRPAPGMANYEAGVSGLYLCGVGAHPGGGLTGLPGKLSAEAALVAEKRS
ncbi:MAG: NAD(P)/FAD-dependent oxidoreductase [Rhodobiaceae bacterium]|nr:NAD(P)/FAD-dependent oxidoreductase [Rhodobiaceae bacterium]